MKDLKSMINHVSDNAELYESQYGAVAKKSATTLLRSILTLEDQGGDLFFGEPALELSDFMPESLHWNSVTSCNAMMKEKV